MEDVKDPLLATSNVNRSAMVRGFLVGSDTNADFWALAPQVSKLTTAHIALCLGREDALSGEHSLYSESSDLETSWTSVLQSLTGALLEL